MLVASCFAVADKTVSFRPTPGQCFTIEGSEHDAGIVGELERSGGLYQRDLAALLQRRLPSDAVCIDGGAHIGVISILLASLCPDGHVYSFEPIPENHGHLLANLAANGITNVTPERAALYREDGELTLAFDEAYPGGSHVGDGKCRVPSVRLDTWVGERKLDRLDLVKLDVEGAEPAVLDGAEETLRRFRPLLVVECNPVALPRVSGTGYRELLHRLQGLYPSVALIGTGGELLPLATDRHLELALNHHGVVDLIGLPGPFPRGEQNRSRGRSATHLARLLATHNRFRPPAENFVVDPGGIALRPTGGPVRGRVAEVLTVPVEVRNGTKTWLSSQFRYQPVHLSYRWDDADGHRAVAEGHRTPLPAPLAPGASVRLDATVQLPAVPGDYELRLTMVQEHFAWLDEIDERCTGRLAASVEEAGP
ncbi:MAG TPA: FkbM family methyltransferase [Acidimicrobiia bacterium]|nr:FkbM family methyltransferase [Acidimicrobiia bacterium]